MALADSESGYGRSITDESSLAAVVRDLLANSGKAPLTLYEKALIELHDAARKGNRRLLDLADRSLSELPREVGVFSAIEELRLQNNALSVLPPTIGNLSQLKRLFLQNNQLERLPSELGLLKNLELLQAQDNRLRELPLELGNLKSLQHLNLRNNRLQGLPASSVKLAALTEFYVEGNSLTYPPEISTRSAPELVSFIVQSGQKDARAISEAKVLFVGQGGVGKTSLVNGMIDGTFDEASPKTEGILIRKWHVSSHGRWLRMNLWDFGGQEIMHATHQFFLTERSLYVLVWDARQEDTYGQLDYWLNIIQSFGGLAPVIVVLNKVDIGSTEIDRRGLQRKFPNVRAFVNCSCKTRVGLAELRDAIAWHASLLPHITTVWPPKWFLVKNELELANKDYISLAEYDALCSQAEINEEEDRRNLLQFLHDLGIVLSFHRDPRLADTNVLNPEWATGGVYRVLNDEHLARRAVLNIEDLPRILTDTRYPRSKHGFIINIMQKFELCYQIDVKDASQFLIPDLLTQQQPFFKWEHRYSLGFQYHYNFLPGSVISRFIVRMHSFVERERVWRNGVILRYKDNRALVIADRAAKKIYISIDGPQTSRRDLLAVIRINFEHIHSTITKIEASPKVPLPDDSSVVVDYQHLLTLHQMGEKSFIPSGLKKRITVAEILWGIEDSAVRSELAEQRLRATDGAGVNVQILNVAQGGNQQMSGDHKNTIKAGRDVSIKNSQVMLDDVKGSVSNYIQGIPDAEKDIKRALQELQRLIENDSVLQDDDKAHALKKAGLLAQVATKTIELSKEGIGDVLASIKGALVDGSSELFEVGKELLMKIKEGLLHHF